MHQLNAAKVHCVHSVNATPSDGDRIDVRACGFTHVEDMMITGDGHDTTISFDDVSSVTLVGFADPHALHLTDFLFA